MNDVVRVSENAVSGFLHLPLHPATEGLVLTHGAGSNCESPLLVAVANAFSSVGYLVLRCDLPFRRARSFGPPSPAHAAGDRHGLKQAVEKIRSMAPGAVFLGGHSYGGRQATMLAAEEPLLVSGLLLLSYPLHPPKKPEQLRTAHFPNLKAACLFVHGTTDPFGSIAELRKALQLIATNVRLLEVEGAGHELMKGKLDTANLVREFRSVTTPQGNAYSVV